MKPGHWLDPEGLPAASIGALVTTRQGGVSRGAYAGFNLAAHVGDDPAAVAANRAWLRRAAELPAEPLWLRQVHGTAVAFAERESGEPVADAAVARSRGRVLAVLTADCLPVLLAAVDASVIAIAHAGWRGLAGGVLEAALAATETPPGRLQAWLGPVIESAHYRVGEAVRDAFAGTPGADLALSPDGPGRWHCDLELLARARLAAAGVECVTASGLGTFAAEDRFYSYRRDGRTGRMASLIWIR